MINFQLIHKRLTSGLLFSIITLLSTSANCIEDNALDSTLSPEKSSFHIRLETEGNSPLQKVILSEKIYLESQARMTHIEQSSAESKIKRNTNKRRFRDRLLRRDRFQHFNHLSNNEESLTRLLSVKDAKGELLPFIINEINDIENKISSPIKLFSLYEQRQLMESTDKLLFKYNRQNLLQEIYSERELKNNTVVGYLLDLGEHSKAKDLELLFELSSVKQTSFLRFSIDQSNDLRNWRRLSSNEVIAQLVQDSLLSRKNTTQLSGVSARYLRINLSDSSPSFSIKSVVQTYTKSQTISPIWTQSWETQWNQDQDELLIELSPAVTYMALKFDLEQSPSILQGGIFARTKSSSSWYKLKNFDLFRIKDGDRIITNDEISLAGLKASQLKVKFDYPNRINSKAPLEPSLAWRPQQLLFLPSGNAPYQIVIESSENSAPNKNHRGLISKIESQINSKIGIAQLGESYSVTKPAIVSTSDYWPKFGLWLTLVTGVFMMLWMVKKSFKHFSENDKT